MKTNKEKFIELNKALKSDVGYIYKIENKLNNKIYIGQTIHDPFYRMKQHVENSEFDKLKNNPYDLYFDLYELGAEKFDFSIIENVNVELLDEKEKFYIKKYNSYFDGYNNNYGGRGNSKYKNNKTTFEIMKNIKFFDNIKDLSNHLNCSEHYIREQTKGFNLNFGNNKKVFYFRDFETEFDNINKAVNFICEIQETYFQNKITKKETLNILTENIMNNEKNINVFGIDIEIEEK